MTKVQVPSKVQVTFYPKDKSSYDKNYDLGIADDIVDWEIRSQFSESYTHNLL